MTSASEGATLRGMSCPQDLSAGVDVSPAPVRASLPCAGSLTSGVRCRRRFRRRNWHWPSSPSTVNYQRAAGGRAGPAGRDGRRGSDGRNQAARVGLQGADRAAARTRQIPVTNAPAASAGNAAAVAEMMFVHLLVLLRGYRAAQYDVAEQQVRQSADTTLAGKAVTVFGTGAIGTAVVLRRDAFDVVPLAGGRRGLGAYPGLAELLSAQRSGRAVELTTPWLSRLPRWPAARYRGHPRPGGHRSAQTHTSGGDLIKVGRGPVLDEAALPDALRTGQRPSPQLAVAAVVAGAMSEAVHPNEGTAAQIRARGSTSPRTCTGAGTRSPQVGGLTEGTRRFVCTRRVIARGCTCSVCQRFPARLGVTPYADYWERCLVTFPPGCSHTWAASPLQGVCAASTGAQASGVGLWVWFWSRPQSCAAPVIGVRSARCGVFAAPFWSTGCRGVSNMAVRSDRAVGPAYLLTEETGGRGGKGMSRFGNAIVRIRRTESGEQREHFEADVHDAPTRMFLPRHSDIDAEDFVEWTTPVGVHTRLRVTKVRFENVPWSNGLFDRTEVHLEPARPCWNPSAGR